MHDSDQGGRINVSVFINNEVFNDVLDSVGSESSARALDTVSHLAVRQRRRLNNLEPVGRLRVFSFVVTWAQIYRMLFALLVLLLFQLLLLPKKGLFVKRVVKRIVCLCIFLVLRANPWPFLHWAVVSLVVSLLEDIFCFPGSFSIFPFSVKVLKMACFLCLLRNGDVSQWVSLLMPGYQLSLWLCLLTFHVHYFNRSPLFQINHLLFSLCCLR